jgi:uncharacterized protein YcbK (DUF882 family)
MTGMPALTSRTETATRRSALLRHVFAAFAISIVAVSAGASASASGDTRTLDLYNNHTKERLTITFKKNGRYIPAALSELNRFLRDWRRNESITMDPHLFDTVWELYQKSGSRQPIHVVCGYRSLATNNMLRTRSSAVAKHSQHTLGKAMDLNIPDVSVDKLRAIGVQMQNGGVGWYPSANSPFVHIDVGSVRTWPRMTRTQLVSLFPDGKTAHIPADGKPLPGYREALAELQQERGVPITTGIDPGRPGAAPRNGGILAMLLGNEEDTGEELSAASNDDDSPAPAKPAAPAMAARAAAPAPTAPAVAAPAAPAAPVLTASLAPKPLTAPQRTTVVTSLADATLPAAGAPVPDITVAAPPMALAAVPMPLSRPDELGPDEDATPKLASLDVPAVLPPTKPAAPAPMLVAAVMPSPKAEAAQAALAEVAHAAPRGEDAIGALAYASSIQAAPTPPAARPLKMAALAPEKPAAPLYRSEPGTASLSVLADGKSDLLGGIEAPLTNSEDGASLLDGGQSVYWGHFTSLRHPDQRSLSSLFAAPVKVAAARFGPSRPYGEMVSTRFTGTVIQPNDVIEFVADDSRLAMR